MRSVGRASGVILVVGCVALFLVASPTPCRDPPRPVCVACPDATSPSDAPSSSAAPSAAPSPSDATAAYARAQASKLDAHFDEIRHWDVREIEPQLTRRFRDTIPGGVGGKTVLCVGARLGGEVRAFKNLGALAVGVDLNPGPANAHVLHGSATAIQFPANVFDVVYTNVLDHIDDLAAFFAETARVSRPSALFAVDVDQNAPDAWSVRDLRGRVPEHARAIEAAGFALLSDDVVTGEKDSGKHALIFRRRANGTRE